MDRQTTIFFHAIRPSDLVMENIAEAKMFVSLPRPAIPMTVADVSVHPLSSRNIPIAIKSELGPSTSDPRTL